MQSPAKIDLYLKTVCRYCDTPLPEPFLELGNSPLANSFLSSNKGVKDEFFCPLSLTFCQNCTLVQLTHVVPPDLMFSNYLYVSSTTTTFQKHFADYAKNVTTRSSGDKKLLAVDIGSNDGLLVSCYQKEGMDALGVEPAKNLSKTANEEGRLTLNQYFDAECVDYILKHFRHVDVISANNVFAHIDGSQEFCKNAHRLLSETGMLVIEFPYLFTMLSEMFFDMIYHEHLSYISLHALSFLLQKHQLQIFDVEKVASHGGSLRVFIQKKGGQRLVSKNVILLMEDEKNKGYQLIQTYKRFAEKVRQFKLDFISLIQDLRGEGKSLSGYGAPAKATTIASYCNLTTSDIQYIVDDNTLKQGKFSPGAHIPVVSSEYLNNHLTNFVIIFAWNFAQEIIRKIEPLRTKGVKFIIPLPHPEIV